MNIYSARSTTATPLAGRAGRGFRRAVALVVAATAGLVSLGLATPAFAMHVPPGGEVGPGSGAPATGPALKVISTGLAAWQVALIAAGAALLGAAAVLLASRLRSGRRVTSSSLA
ncbi:MAG TPA: hypothetical protein VGJ19_14830 [Streptosporangiaceae bacterium]